MISYARIAARFFKAWFMPLPAHDDYVEPAHPDDAPLNNLLTTETPDIPENPDTPHTPHDPDTTTTITTPSSAPAPADPENRNIASIDISHLVNPPEASEARASRGTPLHDPSISE